MGEIADALRRDRKTQPDLQSVRPGSSKSPEGDIRLLADSSKGQLKTSDAPNSSPKSDEKLARLVVAPPGEPRVQSISTESDPEYDAARISVTTPAANASHRYRHMAIRMSRVLAERQAESIVITSPQMGDGKTTTACNLAIALSRLDSSRKVALVDLDLHRPAIAKSLGLKVDVPISHVLTGEARLSDALIPTDLGGLHIVGSGERPSEPESLLSSGRIRSLLAEFREHFSLVILDMPPVLVTSDAASILNLADVGLLVTSAGQSSTRLIQEAMAQVPREKMIGACVNRVRATAARPEYGYGDYGTAPAEEGGGDLTSDAVKVEAKPETKGEGAIK